MGRLVLTTVILLLKLQIFSLVSASNEILLTKPTTFPYNFSKVIGAFHACLNVLISNDLDALHPSNFVSSSGLAFGSSTNFFARTRNFPKHHVHGMLRGLDHCMLVISLQTTCAPGKRPYLNPRKVPQVVRFLLMISKTIVIAAPPTCQINDQGDVTQYAFHHYDQANILLIRLALTDQKSADPSVIEGSVDLTSRVKLYCSPRDIAKNILKRNCTSTVESCFFELQNWYERILRGGRQYCYGHTLDVPDPDFREAKTNPNKYPLEDFKKASPFNNRIRRSLHFGVANFIRSHNGINSSLFEHQETSYAKIWMTQISQDQVPKEFTPSHYFVGRRGDGFKFITMTNVSTKAMPPETFFCPYDSWSLFVIGLFLIVICAGVLAQVVKTLMDRKKKTSRSAILGPLAALPFWIFRALVDQPSDPEVGSKLKRQLQGMTILWIFTSNVLSNLHKSFISADAITPSPYETNWTRIRQLEGFRFYEFWDIDECSIHFPIGLDAPILAPGKRIGGMIPTKVISCRYFDDGCNFMFHTAQAYQDIKNLQKFDGIFQDNTFEEYIFDVFNSTRVWCTANFTQHLKVQALKPDDKVAFVVSESKFKEKWKLFKDLMKQDASYKFGHNLKTRDDFMAPFEVFQVIPILNGSLFTFLPRRLATLYESGIYWLYAKWEDINVKGYVNATFPIDDESSIESLVNPLKLLGSNLAIVFMCWIAGMMIGTLIFLGENVRVRLCKLSKGPKVGSD